mmetsp:Transcript_86403/g.200963  ORF Transcript_86403/g.200963 Transcript_86403/m.200963 type:complete len:110 (+) Transcript_86403:505-834(+)
MREIMCEFLVLQILQVYMILNFLGATRATGTGPATPTAAGGSASLSPAGGPRINGGAGAGADPVSEVALAALARCCLRFGRISLHSRRGTAVPTPVTLAGQCPPRNADA